jgi:uncharacterized protein YydD (DUF2326 family)
MSQLRFFLKLSLLCFKLSFNLLGFGFILITNKIGKTNLANLLLLILIISSLGINFYLYQTKSVVLNTVISVPNNFRSEDNLVTEKRLLDEKEVLELTNFYQTLESNGLQNKAVFLNLNQLLTISGETEQSQIYLERAQRI